MVSKVDTRTQIRAAAEASLEVFIELVHKGRVLGNIHRDVLQWWTRSEGFSHQLLLLPRDHGKSALVAYRVAWTITRNPAVRVLYISATSNLAEKQLKFIKDILSSDVYRFYWPEMIHPEEGKRAKWTESEITVDHPLRSVEAIRDPTIFTAGLTTTVTGLHCDVAVLDDVVEPGNAYTEDGRRKVSAQASMLSSIEGADAQEWVVGTRYHPKDLYGSMISKEIEVYDNEGVVLETRKLYEVYEREVEDRGDGTGQFIWPRQQRYDGKWFGFDANVLAKKRAQYEDRLQFRAQYYNNPNSLEGASIKRDYFQYYEPRALIQREGYWFYKDTRLNVFAAVDFAYSLTKKADFTSIVVVGVDGKNNYYVLDIDRFKSDKIIEYFQHILELHKRWGFTKIRAEISGAQSVIVGDLKQNYIRPYGLALAVDEFRPNRHQGNKEERIAATLYPKYQNLQMWHYRAGNCQLLEEELLLDNPAHDDVKDCLAACVDICVPPSGFARVRQRLIEQKVLSRFGGFG